MATSKRFGISLFTHRRKFCTDRRLVGPTCLMYAGENTVQEITDLYTSDDMYIIVSLISNLVLILVEFESIIVTLFTLQCIPLRYRSLYLR